MNSTKQKAQEESKSTQDNEDEIVLIRVKRGARDDIEELQLEFGKGGNVKRQKLVSANEVLVRNFNRQISVSKPELVFQLGTSKPTPVVTLRRLMGNNETEARKQARDRLLEQHRKKNRDNVINNRRFIQTSEESEFKIIDLQNDNEGDFMYFLALKHGDHLFDPDQEILINGDSDSEVDKDSQDSNRESAEQNDYPDEQSMSDDSDKPKRKPIDISSNNWLDRLLRKYKNGVTQDYTLKQQLERSEADSDQDNMQYEIDLSD